MFFRLAFSYLGRTLALVLCDPIFEGKSEQDSDESPFSEPPEQRPHALFPRAPGSGAETRDISYVMIDRVNDAGVRETSPQDYPAHKIPDRETVYRLFGGGEYKFVAKSRDHQVTAWFPPAKEKRLHITGPSKPMRTLAEYEQMEAERAAPKPPPPVLPPAVPVSAPAPAPTMMNEAFLMFLQHSMQEAAAARAENTRLMLTLVERLSHAPAVPAAPAAIDPMAHLAGLATVVEKLRPPPPSAPAVDPIAQLAGLASVVEKLRPQGAATELIPQMTSLMGLAKQMQGSAPAASTEDDVLKPMMHLLSAMQTPAATPSTPAAPPAPAGAPMVHVFLAGVGPIQMTPAQAQAFYASQGDPRPVMSQAPLGTPPLPATPAPTPMPNPSVPTLDSMVEALAQDPAQIEALRWRLERRLKLTSDTTPAPSAAPIAPSAPSHTTAMPTPSQPASSPLDTAPASPATTTAPESAMPSALDAALELLETLDAEAPASTPVPSTPLPALQAPEACLASSPTAATSTPAEKGSSTPSASTPAAPVASESSSSTAPLASSTMAPASTSTLEATFIAAAQANASPEPISIAVTMEQIQLALSDPELRSMLQPEQLEEFKAIAARLAA